MAEDPAVGTQNAAETRPAPRSETRGFLFADIRGYTEFVERQGASAAAELLLRYRAVVRDAITSNDGAEIRTEGDSFYVVLRSASDAVRCGLAIVTGVAEENASHPGAPIKVGVGIHAGEAIDTAEGLVGSAVNVAARVCALAGPGEVLVTDTVRSLAGNVMPVTFISRGRHRLKGVAEAKELFAARSTTVAKRSAFANRRTWTALVTAVGAVVLVLTGAYLLQGGRGASEVSATPTPPGTVTGALLASPSPQAGSPTPTSLLTPKATGPEMLVWNTGSQVPQHLHAGTYQFSSFQPAVSFTVDPAQTYGDDWWFTCDGPDTATIAAWDGGKQFPGIGDFPFFPSALCWPLQANGKPKFNLLRSGSLGDETCGDAKTVRSTQDVVDWLSGLSVLNTSQPSSLTVAGRSAVQVDTELTGDAGSFCGGTPDPGLGLELIEPAKTHVTILPGDRARLIVFDIGAATPLIIRVESPTELWEPAKLRMQAILDSLTIGN